MARGFRMDVDGTNQAVRAIFLEEEEDQVFESPNGIARCGVKYNGSETFVCWVELFDRNKASLIMDWVMLGIDQAIGGSDDFWAEGGEIVPVVRS